MSTERNIHGKRILLNEVFRWKENDLSWFSILENDSYSMHNWWLHFSFTAVAWLWWIASREGCRRSVPNSTWAWVLSNFAQFDEDVVRQTCIAVVGAVLVSAFDIVIPGWTRAPETTTLGFAHAFKAIWFWCEIGAGVIPRFNNSDVVHVTKNFIGKVQLAVHSWILYPQFQSVAMFEWRIHHDQFESPPNTRRDLWLHRSTGCLHLERCSFVEDSLLQVLGTTQLYQNLTIQHPFEGANPQRLAGSGESCHINQVKVVKNFTINARYGQHVD